MKSFAIAPRPASGGFTLIEVVVVMLIFSVVIAMVAVMTRGVTAAQKRSLTATRMAGVEAALIQFVLQQKRLPCPADGRLASTDNNAGLESGWTAAGCAVVAGSSMTHGVVPWRALALTDVETMDGWDRRLTYRVFPALAATSGMDMSWCDPAGTGPLTVSGACSDSCAATTPGSCTPPSTFLGTKGLTVRNVAGTVLMEPLGPPSVNTGAAYVLISHGESGGGAYLNTGVLATSTVGDGTEELRNYASLPFVSGVTFYIDDTTNDTVGTAHFDDIVARPSILTVATKAGLAPRAH